MGRHLYYQDSYGRIHRDRATERAVSGAGSSGGSQMPARFFAIVLMILAAIMVVASPIH